MAAGIDIGWNASVSSNPVIAILDDEPQLRRALQRLLVAHGFAVVTFERGQDLLAALEAQPMDCLLLDLYMPGTDGYKVLESISARHLSTPVILMTGHGEPATASQVRDMGAVAYLDKPVDEAELLSAINQAIDSPSFSRRSFP
jgi:FixJ family two-component response regulator